MGEIFKVSLNYRDQDGHVEYDVVNKAITVIFADQAAQRIVSDYLGHEQIINVSQSLRDFKETIINPSENIESFKMALTRMWAITGVLVQWSKPV